MARVSPKFAAVPIFHLRSTSTRTIPLVGALGPHPPLCGNGASAECLAKMLFGAVRVLYCGAQPLEYRVPMGKHGAEDGLQ
eukprot:15471095-Alexandrium_andersonii.AAC.1